MITTSPILSEIQNQTFADSAKALIDGRDLSYRGFSLKDDLPITAFSLQGTEAVKNKVMLWLISTYGDYVREPDKGGPLENLIGRTFTEENKKIVERSLSVAFTDFFQEDLELIAAVVTMDVDSKRWVIKIIVRDPIRRELFDIAVGVRQ